MRLLIFLCIFLAACTERVTPGSVGMIMNVNGFQEKVLGPGNHTCWGRDRMVLIETTEEKFKEDLKIQCADDSNFSCDLYIRLYLNIKDAKGIKKILEKQGKYIKWKSKIGDLPLRKIYETYVQSLARPIARSVISKFKSTHVRDNRENINKSIQEQLLKAANDTPVTITMVMLSNLDYDPVVQESINKKLQRQMEIEEEKANQAKELLIADNKHKLVLANRKAKLAEAETEAAYNKILAESVSDKYLELLKLQNQKILYQNVGQGDKIIMTNSGSVVPTLSVADIENK